MDLSFISAWLDDLLDPKSFNDYCVNGLCVEASDKVSKIVTGVSLRDQLIDAAIAELAEAVDAFKAAVPASAITTIVDIDFENEAVLNEETQLYSIAGAAWRAPTTYYYMNGRILTGDKVNEKLIEKGSYIFYKK